MSTAAPAFSNVDTNTPFRQILQEDQSGWKIAVCYWLQLDHHCMGMFPAVYVGTKDIALFLSWDALELAWRSLHPRRSRASRLICYVNPYSTLAYALNFDHHEDQLRAKPMKILPLEKAEALKKDAHDVIEWAPGLMGASCSDAEYDFMIENSRLAFRN